MSMREPVPHTSDSFYIVTKATIQRGCDTRVDGASNVSHDGSVLTVRGRDGAVLFMAPLSEIVYVKAVDRRMNDAVGQD